LIAWPKSFSDIDFTSIRNQLEHEIKDNKRLQRLIWAIVYILVFYFILVLQDEIGALEFKAQTSVKNLSRYSAYDNDENWGDYRNQEQQVFQGLNSDIWPAKTPGLASADLQTFMQTAVREHEISSFRLKLGEPKTMEFENQPMWLVQAELIGKIPKKEFPKLMADLEKEGKSVLIERITFSPSRGDLLNLLVSIRAREVPK